MITAFLNTKLETNTTLCYVLLTFDLKTFTVHFKWLYVYFQAELKSGLTLSPKLLRNKMYFDSCLVFEQFPLEVCFYVLCQFLILL